MIPLHKTSVVKPIKRTVTGSFLCKYLGSEGGGAVMWRVTPLSWLLRPLASTPGGRLEATFQTSDKPILSKLFLTNNKNFVFSLMIKINLKGLSHQFELG